MGGVIHPLHQVDLLTPAERKITEKEYWAQRRGQEKLDKLNQKMKEDGITPKETRYQTEKQFLRDAIEMCIRDSYQLYDCCMISFCIIIIISVQVLLLLCSIHFSKIV